MKKIKTVIFIVLAILVFLVLFFGYEIYNMPNKIGSPVACTKEAKICPDGSTVGRIGPNCEFAACPDFTIGWKTYTNKQYKFSLKYPVDFFDENQQPILFAGNCNYNVFPGKCPNINDIVATQMATDGGDLSIIKSNLSNSGYWDNPAGQRQTINNIQYCLYTTGDAATGHAFNYYYFTTVKNEKCMVIYLATSTENCDFYLPLEKGNTEQADNYKSCLKKTGEQPKILNEIISTFKFTN